MSDVKVIYTLQMMLVDKIFIQKRREHIVFNLLLAEISLMGRQKKFSSYYFNIKLPKMM